MQGTQYNLEKDCALKGYEVMGSFEPRHSQKRKK